MISILVNLKRKLTNCTLVLGYEEKEKLLETVSFLRSICFILSYIMSLLKKITASFLFLWFDSHFLDFFVTVKMMFRIVFLLFPYYYLYNQNISHWSSCFYWPFGLLKTLTKTEKKEKDTFIQVIIYPGDRKTVRFGQVSVYSVHFEEYFYENLLGKRPGPKVVVGLSQVSASEHVRFNQVSLFLSRIILGFELLPIRVIQTFMFVQGFDVKNALKLCNCSVDLPAS